jgi:hypothetical protein
MTSTSIPRLTREFTLRVCFSFIIALGIIHAASHLLHTSIVTGLALCSPFFAKPALQLAQILHLHTFVVLEVTVACSILALALREMVSAVGSMTGWWDLEGQEEDMEAGDPKMQISKQEPGRTDKKLP